MTRIFEIDFFRGLAILFMVYFHIIYDLNEFLDFNVSYSHGFNFFIGKISAILFMLICGISSSFSKNNFKRGSIVLSLGLLITLITYLFQSDQIIMFGILHFLGFCMLLFPVLNKLSVKILIILSIVLLITGMIIKNYYFEIEYLFFIGIRTKLFFSSDYYPILPWISIFILGIILGKTIYTNKSSVLNNNIKYNYICKIGKHSLIIYLLHQPIIILIINLFQPK